MLKSEDVKSCRKYIEKDRREVAKQQLGKFRFSSPIQQALLCILILAISQPVLAASNPMEAKAGVSSDIFVPSPHLRVEPKFHVAVQFVRTADDDGGRASTLTKANAQAAIDRMNTIWSRNGGDIKYYLHPGSNFQNVIESSLLNRDCQLKPGQTAESIAALMNPDLNGDGLNAQTSDIDVICDQTSTTIARTAFAIARANRVIVWSRGGNDRVKYNKKAGHWVLDHPLGGSSAAKGYYIIMPKTFSGSTLLAHEMGHYMHAAHTFKNNPKTISEARVRMEQWAKDHPGNAPQNVFDGDASATFAVYDTPPDPGIGLWAAVHDNVCDPAATNVKVPVTVNGLAQWVVLAPDRSNLMSYFTFTSCDFRHHLSAGQFVEIHKALTVGNRKALVNHKKKSRCYANEWTPGPPVDSETKLAQFLSNVAACTLWYKEPMPWEIVMNEDVYINPSVAMQGFTQRGPVAVHLARERALIKSLINVQMVD